MKPDREDNECRTAEPPSFARVRAELLAVVMTNHPEFTLKKPRNVAEARLSKQAPEGQARFPARPSSRHLEDDSRAGGRYSLRQLLAKAVIAASRVGS